MRPIVVLVVAIASAAAVAASIAGPERLEASAKTGQQHTGDTMNRLVLILLGAGLVSQCASQQQQSASMADLPASMGAELTSNFPYYLLSPMGQKQQGDFEAAEMELGRTLAGDEAQLSQRSMLKPKAKRPSAGTARMMNVNQVPALASSLQIGKQDSCQYQKQYFAKIDECLARKPYPTVGLPAFKNEDLVIKRGLSEKNGCSFLLDNGVFKNYQVSRYSIDGDTQCLDGTRVGLSMTFSNVTLSYLWILRCLNRADQLLDDATLNGKTLDGSVGGENQAGGQEGGICVGSSQSFGFASLQLTNLEAQVELATDIYKNWRVTNVTVAMINSPAQTARSASSTAANLNTSEPSNPSSSMKEFVFELLDGDELNWRYLHLFQNWSRNRMHANFLDQYRRFLWLSLQRCLRESSERLPAKLTEVFAYQKYS